MTETRVNEGGIVADTIPTALHRAGAGLWCAGIQDTMYCPALAFFVAGFVGLSIICDF